MPRHDPEVCIRGHPRTPENTKVSRRKVGDGWRVERQCKVCKQDFERAAYRAKTGLDPTDPNDHRARGLTRRPFNPNSYPCGHARTEENSYKRAGRGEREVRYCKTCHLEKANAATNTLERQLAATEREIKQLIKEADWESTRLALKNLRRSYSTSIELRGKKDDKAQG